MVIDGDCGQPTITDVRTKCDTCYCDKKKYTIRVYIDNGVIFEYDVESPEKVREHADAIVKEGYRHNDGKTIFEHYGPHRIKKVQCKALIPTIYPDRMTGT